MLSQKKISTPPCFTLLFPSSHLQPRKLPSKQTCIIQRDCGVARGKQLLDFMAPSLNISPFFGDQAYQ